MNVASKRLPCDPGQVFVWHNRCSPQGALGFRSPPASCIPASIRSKFASGGVVKENFTIRSFSRTGELTCPCFSTIDQ